MTALKTEYWSCPFCDKGKIEVMVRPASYSIRRSYGAGKGSIPQLTKEESTIVSEKCPNCGKIKKEIIRAYKEGTSKDKKRRKERIAEVLRLREELRNARK